MTLPKNSPSGLTGPLAAPPARDWPSKLSAAWQALWRIGSAVGRRPIPNRLLGEPSDPLSVATSYVILRNGIGVLGFALPIVIIFGGGLDHVQGSLSAYYHFSADRPGQYGAGMMRDLFVGMLCAIGAFLFFYRGHSLQEDIALNVAGISAVLVALFPMDWPPGSAAATTTAARIHSGAATLFFVMIAYVCVFRGRDTLCIVDDDVRRRAFERIYLIFGLLMLATPATVALLTVTTAAAGGYNILVVETGGVFVFAAFWLVKSFEIRTAVRRSDRVS